MKKCYGIKYLGFNMELIESNKIVLYKKSNKTSELDSLSFFHTLCMKYYERKYTN